MTHRVARLGLLKFSTGYRISFVFVQTWRYSEKYMFIEGVIDLPSYLNCLIRSVSVLQRQPSVWPLRFHWQSWHPSCDRIPTVAWFCRELIEKCRVMNQGTVLAKIRARTYAATQPQIRVLTEASILASMSVSSVLRRRLTDTISESQRNSRGRITFRFSAVPVSI